MGAHMSKLPVVFLLGALATSPLSAGTAEEHDNLYAFRASKDLASVEFGGESDLLGLGGLGNTRVTAARAAYVSPSLSGDPAVWNTRMHAGFCQEAYSAQDKSGAPPRDDRPYAGWLYGFIGMGWEDESSLDLLTLRAGVVGPSSLGQNLQDAAHDLAGVDRAKGWRTQLRDEPGVDVEWRRTWRIRLAGKADGFGADVLPRLGYEVGTVRHLGMGGLQLRAGKNLPLDFGVRTIRDGAVDGAPVKYSRDGYARLAPDAYYLFLDAQVESRFWDMTLDGNMYHDGNGVKTHAGVARVGFGVAAHWAGVKVAAGEYFLTEEYKGQDGPSCFGGVTLTTAF